MKLKKTYAFAVDFEQESDGRWSADLPAAPVCAAWGYTKEEALETLQDLAQTYFAVLADCGDLLPEGIERCEVTPGSAGATGPETVTISL